MAKRYIGIDISDGWVHAVQMARRGGLEIELSASRPIVQGQDSPAEALCALTEQCHFDRSAPVAVAMPHGTAFAQSIDIDEDNLNGTVSTFDSIAQENFPIAAGERLGDICCCAPKAIVAATSKSAKKERLEIIGQAKLQTELIDLPVFALLATVKTNHPQINDGLAIIIYTDQSHCITIITENSQIVATRTMPLAKAAQTIIHELQMTWRTHFAEPIPENTNAFVAGDAVERAELIESLQNELKCNVIETDPFAKIKCPADQADNYSVCLAEGLAIRGLDPQNTAGVNLQRGENTKTKNRLTTQKQTILLITLATAVLGIYAIGTIVKLVRLEKQYDQIKTEAREAFTKALPNEKNIVDELSQIQTELQTAQSRYSILKIANGHASGPLDTWRAINQSTPQELGIRIDEMELSGNTAKIRASCSSIETARQWQQTLKDSPHFDSADIENLAEPDGSAETTFTVTLTGVGGGA